jgi:hypothetical protein
MVGATIFYLFLAATAVLSTAVDTDSTSNGRLLKQFNADGKEYAIHAFGQLVDAPVVAPPPVAGNNIPREAICPS